MSEKTAKKPAAGKRAAKKTKEAKPQLGWSDWLATTAAPTASASLTDEKPPSEVKAPARDWSKLEFPPTAAAKKSAEKSTAESTEKVSAETPPAAAATKSAANDREKCETETTSRAEPVVLTVGALNKLIRGKLEKEFSVLWLRGEISNFKAHPSGHFYFSLKDRDAQISAVMFRGYNSQLRFKPEDGMEVVVRGKITVFEPRGNYQIMCESMEPVGAGALQKAFEQLKAKLQAEGLFDAARKRAIPTLPKHIGLVTSPSGAAIRDMLNVLRRRYKSARITLVPCSVQGERAPREIVGAIALANRLVDLDVLIVGRGGGSIEDLWAFNEEAVARAIAGSRVPVISAVGHEIDFTIADFVADLRAPTPSAAAELVAKSIDELSQSIARSQRALALALRVRLQEWRERVRTAHRLLIDPRRSIEDAILRCDELTMRLHRAVMGVVDATENRIERAHERLVVRVQKRLAHVRETFARAAVLLDSLSPLKVLDRGYAIATAGRDGQRAAITDTAMVKPGDDVDVRLARGAFTAKITRIHPTGGA